jgi:hypothetical protein
VPLYWANTQNNLGIVAETLGERESGTVSLEAAVAATMPLSGYSHHHRLNRKLRNL